MAEVNIFHYIPGNTFIHRMDVRIKFFCAILLSVTACAARILDLAFLSLVLIIALLGSAIPVKKLLSEIKYFLFLIGLVVIVHTFSIPGAAINNFPLHPTWEGLRSGVLFGWRIIIMILISSLLTATTTLVTLKNVIEWFLRPIPFIPETKVATMIGLTFTLIPLIFDQASEMLDAQKARCIEARRNLVFRIVSLSFPLLLHTIMRADGLVSAMESRCYCEDRTPAVFKTRPGDWVILILSGLLCGMVWVKFLI